MITIDFIRHAEPDTTIHDDWLRPLTAMGQRQAVAIAARLQQEQYNAIYSSPLKRAVATITPLADALELPVQTDDLLVERMMPGWVPDFRAYVQQQWQDFMFAEGAGESLAQAQQRYLQFIAALPDGAKVAVATHGTALSTVVEAAQPGFGYHFWQELPFAGAVRMTVDGAKLAYIGMRL